MKKSNLFVTLSKKQLAIVKGGRNTTTALTGTGSVIDLDEDDDDQDEDEGGIISLPSGTITSKKSSASNITLP